MKRILVTILALVMIPVFLGVLCPCAVASPADQLSIQKMKCHGCCPEMADTGKCDMEIAPVSKVASIRENLQVVNVLKALCPRESQGIAINRRALVPAGDEPLSLSQPLYLLNSVFRI